MADETDIAEHLSVAMTTDDVTRTATDAATPSSSYGIEFYFKCAVVVIGVVGTAVNFSVLATRLAGRASPKIMTYF